MGITPRRGGSRGRSRRTGRNDRALGRVRVVIGAASAPAIESRPHSERQASFRSTGSSERPCFRRATVPLSDPLWNGVTDASTSLVRRRRLRGPQVIGPTRNENGSSRRSSTVSRSSEAMTLHTQRLGLKGTSGAAASKPSLRKRTMGSSALPSRWPFPHRYGSATFGRSEIFVLPSHRGLGVGRRLLDSIRAAALASGACASQYRPRPTTHPRCVCMPSAAIGGRGVLLIDAAANDAGQPHGIDHRPLRGRSRTLAQASGPVACCARGVPSRKGSAAPLRHSLPERS